MQITELNKCVFITFINYFKSFIFIHFYFTRIICFSPNYQYYYYYYCNYYCYYINNKHVYLCIFLYLNVPGRNRMECLQIQDLKQINILLKYAKENYKHSNNFVLNLFSQNKNTLNKLPHREVKRILRYQGFPGFPGFLDQFCLKHIQSAGKSF